MLFKLNDSRCGLLCSFVSSVTSYSEREEKKRKKLFMLFAFLFVFE